MIIENIHEHYKPRVTCFNDIKMLIYIIDQTSLWKD